MPHGGGFHGGGFRGRGWGGGVDYGYGYPYWYGDPYAYVVPVAMPVEVSDDDDQQDVTSGDPEPRGPFDVMQDLVAAHETYWSRITELHPDSQVMQWWMTDKWSPFYVEWVNLVSHHGLSNVDTNVIAHQLSLLNGLRLDAKQNEIPVPHVEREDPDTGLIVGVHMSRPHAPRSQDAEREINDATDEQFWAETNYKPGRRLDPRDPMDHAMINTWLKIRYEIAEQYAAAHDGNREQIATRGSMREKNSLILCGRVLNACTPFVPPAHSASKPIVGMHHPMALTNIFPDHQAIAMLGELERHRAEKLAGWWHSLENKVNGAVKKAAHYGLHPSDIARDAARKLGAGKGWQNALSYVTNPLQDITENPAVQQMVATTYGGPAGAAALQAANALQATGDIGATLKTMAPQIASAAAGAAGAAGGPAAAQLASSLVNAAAGTGSLQQTANLALNVAQQAASSDPQAAAALDAAHKAVAQTTAAYHVAKTLAAAGNGDSNAVSQVKEMTDAAAQGDPDAKTALDAAKAITDVAADNTGAVVADAADAVTSGALPWLLGLGALGAAGAGVALYARNQGIVSGEVVGSGNCGSRTFAGVTHDALQHIFDRLHAKGAEISGNNPWFVVTHDHGVELSGAWDENAGSLVLTVTDSDPLAFCSMVWDALESMLAEVGAHEISA